MKIGIYGGCFNPPHNIHKDLPLKLIEKGYVDKVIYVPTGNKYNKLNLASNEDRYNMLKILVDKNNNLALSDFEFKNKLVYTYQTMDYFKNKYPNDILYFICGTDNLEELDKWKNYEYIITNYKFLVANRAGTSISKMLNKYKKFVDNILVINIEKNKVSSTIIRERLKNNEDDISELIDENILDYIRQKKLY
jgi:nicotinate (nicotinamide) nucleotide adenylyltransferase